MSQSATSRFAGARRMGIATVILGVERVCRLMGVIFATGVLAKHLGPEKFGIFSSVLSLVTMVSILGDFGVARIVIRELITKSVPETETLGAALIVRTLGGLAVLVGSVLATILFFRNEHPDAVTLGVTFSVAWLFRVTDIMDWAFQAKARLSLSAMPRIVGIVASTVFQIHYASAGAGLVILSYSLMVEYAVSAIGLVFVWTYTKQPSIGSFTYREPTVRKLLITAYPLFFAYASAHIYGKCDQVLLAYLGTPVDAGLFAASSRIYEVVIGLSGLLQTAWYPEIVRWYDRGESHFRRRYVIITRFMTLIALATFAIVVTSRQWLVVLVFGQEFAPAADILCVQMATAVLMYNGLLRANYFILSGETNMLAIFNTAAAISIISLDFILIPYFGALGAACATFLGQLITLQLMNLCFANTRWLFFAQLGINQRPHSTQTNEPDGRTGS